MVRRIDVPSASRRSGNTKQLLRFPDPCPSNDFHSASQELGQPKDHMPPNQDARRLKACPRASFSAVRLSSMPYIPAHLIAPEMRTRQCDYWICSLQTRRSPWRAVIRLAREESDACMGCAGMLLRYGHAY
ncbi:hypothetical protein BD414DRAFT_481636 [Trametes punicea]|nr:hypothetical protein BD414DRAFT_481636 [Trametes punicea]